jgi:hypothetical protein
MRGPAQPLRSAFAGGTAGPYSRFPSGLRHWIKGQPLWRGCRACALPAGPAFYTAGMSEDTRPGEEEAQHEELPALPRHLSALIGSLRGPADLGRNHDKYLTYADREEAGGAASA